MISKQEGGTDRGRLRLPGEQGDWAARNLIPSLPGSLWLLGPGGELLLPGSGGSGVPGGPAWTRSGRAHHQIRAAHLHIGRTSGVSLGEASRCVIVFQSARQIRVSACSAARAVKNEAERRFLKQERDQS